MKIIACKQGTDDWLEARLGIPTASEFDNLVTPLWKVKAGEMVETYLAKKLAERWRGAPLASFSGGAMEQGSILESEAIPWYEFEYNVTVRRVGFVLSDCGKSGCSPDGLITDDMGLEVKCPEPHTHVKYLLDGELPKAYAAQVQGSMLVTGLPAWRFLSYCRGFPSLVLTVKADSEAQVALAEALDKFNARLDAGYARLVELNGGPPGPAAEPDETGDIDLSLLAHPLPRDLTAAESAAIIDQTLSIMDEKGF